MKNINQALSKSLITLFLLFSLNAWAGLTLTQVDLGSADFDEVVRHLSNTGVDAAKYAGDNGIGKGIPKAVKNGQKTIAYAEFIPEGAANRTIYKSISGTNDLSGGGFSPNVNIQEGLSSNDRLVNGIYSYRLQYDARTKVDVDKPNPDAEFKIMHQVQADVPANGRGTLRLYVSRPPCGAASNPVTGCSRALNDLSRNRPNIDIEVKYIKGDDATVKEALTKPMKASTVRARAGGGAGC